MGRRIRPGHSSRSRDKRLAFWPKPTRGALDRRAGTDRCGAECAITIQPHDALKSSLPLAVKPPVEPMLAKLADELPAGDYLYEPKWDGFRAIVFRSADGVYIQSRDARPLDRYFPDLHEALLERVPENCAVDGEIVIATAHGLDFDTLQLRLHPASSRVEKLAKATPASFVAFDVLAVAGRNLMTAPQAARRTALEELLVKVSPPVYLTPVTRDRAIALDWLTRFEGAGLDGVIAKPASGTY